MLYCSSILAQLMFTSSNGTISNKVLVHDSACSCELLRDGRYPVRAYRVRAPMRGFTECAHQQKRIELYTYIE